MKQWLKLVGIVCLMGITVLALRAKTDRIFNQLTPTEGQAYAIPLKSGHIYTQALQIPRTTLSRLGFWLSPLQRNMPAVSLQIAIKEDSTILRTVSLPLQTLASDGATYVTISPVITVKRNAIVELQLTVPPEANQAVSVQVREPDTTFDAAAIPFQIDGVTQPRPLALEAYAFYRPSFMIGIGIGLLVIAFLWLTYPFSWRYNWLVYIVTLTVIGAVPGLLNQSWYPLLLLTLLVASSGMWQLLRQLGLSPVAAITGVNIWTLTTWFPLQMLGQRDYLLAWAALPYLILVWQAWRQSQHLIRNRSLLIAVVWLGITLIAGHSVWQHLPPGTTANLKDIFADPYQIAVAQKSIGAAVPWDNFGSYVGVINIGLIIIGLFWQGLRRWRWITTAIVSLVIALWPPFSSGLQWLLISPQYFLIIATFCLSVFGAWGMQGLVTYLRPSKLTTVITWGIVIIAFLDLLYVWTNVIEFTSL